MNLLNEWRFLFAYKNLGDEPDNYFFNKLVKNYYQSHRHYHTLSHIQDLITKLDLNKTDLMGNEKKCILLAVWFHDIIYKPLSKTNELDSVEEFKKAAVKLCIDPSIVDRVSYMIECTIDHNNYKNDYITQLFLDADLSILGSDKETYKKYLCQIRKEYFQVPLIGFKEGRIKFLKEMFSREYIFSTPDFFNQYEKQARKNLEDECYYYNVYPYPNNYSNFGDV